MNKPSIGRIVIYKLTEEDKEISRKAGDNVTDEVPAIIVNVWSDTCLNLRVFVDGNYTWWKTSTPEGDQPGNWHWPVIQK